MRWNTACSLLVVALLALSAGAGELRVAVWPEPLVLDPTTDAAAVIKLLLHHNVYETLIQFDAQAELHGQLAVGWDVSDDGPGHGASRTVLSTIR